MYNANAIMSDDPAHGPLKLRRALLDLLLYNDSMREPFIAPRYENIVVTALVNDRLDASQSSVENDHFL